MLTFERNGRLWLEIGREPYCRKDGSTTELIVWACRCASDGCSESVEVKTPTAGYESSKSFGAKHCEAHKLSPDQVNDRFKAAVKARRAAK